MKCRIVGPTAIMICGKRSSTQRRPPRVQITANKLGQRKARAATQQRLRDLYDEVTGMEAKGQGTETTTPKPSPTTIPKADPKATPKPNPETTSKLELKTTPKPDPETTPTTKLRQTPELPEITLVDTEV